MEMLFLNMNFLNVLNVILSLIILVAILIFPYLLNYDKVQFVKRFNEVITKGVISKSITYLDIQEISEYWYQDRKSVLHNLRRLLYKSLNREDGLENSTEFIRKLLNEHKASDPFYDLPKNIGVQLEEIQNRMDVKEKNKIQQLNAALSDIYLSNNNKAKSHRRWSYASGAIGTVAAIITLGQLIIAVIPILSK